MSLHCAQRGCALPDDATTGGLCPVCNNPLIVVVHDDAPVSHGQLGEDGAVLVDAALPSSDPEAEFLGDDNSSGEVFE